MSARRRRACRRTASSTYAPRSSPLLPHLVRLTFTLPAHDGTVSGAASRTALRFSAPPTVGAPDGRPAPGYVAWAHDLSGGRRYDGCAGHRPARPAAAAVVAAHLAGDLPRGGRDVPRRHHGHGDLARGRTVVGRRGQPCRRSDRPLAAPRAVRGRRRPGAAGATAVRAVPQRTATGAVPGAARCRDRRAEARPGHRLAPDP